MGIIIGIIGCRLIATLTNGFKDVAGDRLVAKPDRRRPADRNFNRNRLHSKFFSALRFFLQKAIFR